MGGPGAFSDEIRLVVTVLESRRLRDQVIDQFDWMEKYGLDDRLAGYERFMKNIVWEVSEHGSIRLAVMEEDPELAAATANFIIDRITEEYTRITVEQARIQRQFIERRLDLAYQELDAIEDTLRQFQEETGAVAVEDQVRVTVEAFAELKAQLIMAEVSREVARRTLPAGSAQIIQSETQVEMLQEQVDAILNASAAENQTMFIGLDEAPEVGIRYLELVRSMEISQKVLEFLVPQFEQARITEMREQGNLYILDPGVPPEKKFKPRRSFLVIALMIVAFILLYVYVLFVEWLNRLRTHDPQQYEKVSVVLTGLLPQNLFRWKE